MSLVKCNANIHVITSVNIREYQQIVNKFLADGTPRTYRYKRSCCLDCHYEKRFGMRRKEIKLRRKRNDTK